MKTPIPDNLPPLPPVLSRYDVGKLKRGQRVRVGNREGVVTSPHEPSWVDHKTRAFRQELQGADVQFDGDAHGTYIHIDSMTLIEAVRDEPAKCRNCDGIGGVPDDLCPDCEGSGVSEPAKEPATVCHCQDCNPSAWWMIVCSKCGNKRCPHAAHHLNECTGSNEPGQAMEHEPRPQNRLAAFPALQEPATGVEARVCELERQLAEAREALERLLGFSERGLSPVEKLAAEKQAREALARIDANDQVEAQSPEKTI